MDNLGEYLKDIAENEEFPQYTRGLAIKALQQWNRNVIPEPSLLNKIRKAIQPPPPCSRPTDNGSCVWLRKHGAGHRLPVPPIGEKATCCFKGEAHKCPGYKKLKADL